MDLVRLGGTLYVEVPVLANNSPYQPPSAPTYTIRDAETQQVMPNGTGVASQVFSGAIQSVTGNAVTPIVVTSAGHKLGTNQRVRVEGVGGNTAANNDWTITVIDGDRFSLNGSVGNGAYTSGGTWKAIGLFHIAHEILAADGYQAGKTYYVTVLGTSNGAPAQGLGGFRVT